MVFQSYALFPHMSVRDNVAYGLLSSGRSKKDALEKAQEGLRLVGLDQAGDRLPSALSGGQQQRVAVARALVLEPSVLLLDEPLSNLDARLRRKMREDIREIQQRLGVTAVYVTHDQAEALSVSDAIIVMEKGRIAQIGSPRELYEAPRSAFIAGFMGEANLLRGVLRGGVVEIEGGVRIEVAHPGLPDGPVEAAVRPEAVRIAKRNGDEGTLAGRIAKATYLGSHMEYTLETAAGELFAIAHDSKAPFRENDEVEVSFEPNGVAIVRAE
jgi:iron(III) transport system ATP-binding protein